VKYPSSITGLAKITFFLDMLKFSKNNFLNEILLCKEIEYLLEYYGIFYL